MSRFSTRALSTAKIREEFKNKKINCFWEDLVPDGTFKYIKNFSILRLDDQEQIDLASYSWEIGIVVLRGNCRITIDDQKATDLGSRNSVFEKKLPWGFYIPRDTDYSIQGWNRLELAICKGRCEKKTEPKLISPEDVEVTYPGKDNWKREVRMIIGPKSPSVGLMVGETINPPGNWSGSPAHKHDVMDLPHERIHEELYFFKTEKTDGFGIQRLYSPERGIDELILLKEGTVVFIPWGYHQPVAGPGYRLYYLFFLCGQDKQLVASFDPKHRWLVDSGGTK